MDLESTLLTQIFLIQHLISSSKEIGLWIPVAMQEDSNLPLLFTPKATISQERYASSHSPEISSRSYMYAPCILMEKNARPRKWH